MAVSGLAESWRVLVERMVCVIDAGFDGIYRG